MSIFSKEFLKSQMKVFLLLAVLPALFLLTDNAVSNLGHVNFILSFLEHEGAKYNAKFHSYS